jgi:hypothetical protein
MFSVDETSLSILRTLRGREKASGLGLHAIVPYAYEYVRLATQAGGVPGLASGFARQLILSGNIRAFVLGLKGFAKADIADIMKAYLLYEYSRIKSSSGNQANFHSLLLHQVITDMALALNLEWLFKSYIEIAQELGVTPGFNTGNFAYLVSRFTSWKMDLHRVFLAAPFNKVGFQMNPSKEECEKALASLPEPTTIAISVLAAGYLKPQEAIDYIATLPNIQGVAVGVSKESHACETFRLLKEKLR